MIHWGYEDDDIRDGLTIATRPKHIRYWHKLVNAGRLMRSRSFVLVTDRETDASVLTADAEDMIDSYDETMHNLKRLAIEYTNQQRRGVTDEDYKGR